MTSKANIIHVGSNAIHIHQESNEDNISMVNNGRLSYVPLFKFNLTGDESVPVLSCLTGNFLSSRPWSKIKQTADKIHKYICGHATSADNLIVLGRNDKLNNEVSKYVHKVV